MGCSVKVGNAVPLSAQVECPDPSETLYIRAFVYNQANVQLATRDLNDRGNGRFEDLTTYIMPNLDTISVQYMAFSDDQYLSPLDEPCPDTEIFKKLEETGGGGSSAGSGVQAVGKIIGGTIRGKVCENRIFKGKITSGVVTGKAFASNQIIKGRVIANQIIKGKVICKK